MGYMITARLEKGVGTSVELRSVKNPAESKVIPYTPIQSKVSPYTHTAIVVIILWDSSQV